MNIEIVTTKKKLTKSILNQMPRANLDQMLSGEVLGYISNSLKYMDKVYLIIWRDKYFLLPANFKKGGKSITRKVGKWLARKDFETVAECDSWWDAYMNIIKKDLEQIYI